jgi:hypothetical protein
MCKANRTAALLAFGGLGCDDALDMLVLPAIPNACDVACKLLTVLADAHLIEPSSASIMIGCCRKNPDESDEVAMSAAKGLGNLIYFVSLILTVQRMAVLNDTDMLAAPSPLPRPWHLETSESADVLCIPAGTADFALASELKAERKGLVLDVFPRKVSDVVYTSTSGGVIKRSTPVVPVTISGIRPHETASKAAGVAAVADDVATGTHSKEQDPWILDALKKRKRDV